jgi:hypothetical protein
MFAKNLLLYNSSIVQQPLNFEINSSSDNNDDWSLIKQIQIKQKIV